MKNGKNKQEGKHTVKKNTVFMLTCFSLSIILNILARVIPGFADWHIRFVFPIWVNTYGRLTSLFPFSVGEWLIVLGLILTGVLLLSLCFLWQKTIRRYVKKYIRIYLNIVVVVVMIMTQNCFILYQGSTFTDKYGIRKDCITEENLILVRNEIVHQANELALCMERDEEGNIVYQGNLIRETRKEMVRLGKTYEQLAGFYVTPKWIYHSAFLSQQYILGYYFPFSMEANLNSYQYLPNVPVTICHELAHTKGFLLEDEANYIGFLACVDSTEPFFQYSAYLSVLYYVEKAYRSTIAGKEEDYQDAEQILPVVWDDDIFLTEESWKEVEEKQLFSTKTVEKATDVFLNTNLKVNGVSDGTVSYSRVVQLLLTYYDGILW